MVVLVIIGFQMPSVDGHADQSEITVAASESLNEHPTYPAGGQPGQSEGATAGPVRFAPENESTVAALACAPSSGEASVGTEDAAGCVASGLFPFLEQDVEPPTLTEVTAGVNSAFSRLQLPGTGITIQPPGSKAIRDLDVIVYTDPTPVDHHDTILGYPLTIRATPILFTWDFGDGVTHTTTDPGQPWPEPTTTHRYGDTGPVTISLTTTWQGEFQINSGAWIPITSHATTTDVAPQIEIIDHRTRLIPVD